MNSYNQWINQEHKLFIPLPAPVVINRSKVTQPSVQPLSLSNQSSLRQQESRPQVSYQHPELHEFSDHPVSLASQSFSTSSTTPQFSVSVPQQVAVPKPASSAPQFASSAPQFSSTPSFSSSPSLISSVPYQFGNSTDDSYLDSLLEPDILDAIQECEKDMMNTIPQSINTQSRELIESIESIEPVELEEPEPMVVHSNTIQFVPSQAEASKMKVAADGVGKVIVGSFFAKFGDDTLIPNINRLLSTCPRTIQDLRRANKNVFGHNDFRPGCHIL